MRAKTTKSTKVSIPKTGAALSLCAVAASARSYSGRFIVREGNRHRGGHAQRTAGNCAHEIAYFLLDGHEALWDKGGCQRGFLARRPRAKE